MHPGSQALVLSGNSSVYMLWYSGGGLSNAVIANASDLSFSLSENTVTITSQTNHTVTVFHMIP